MTNTVFLDTSAWIAALTPTEPRHRDAITAYTEAIGSGRRIVTTNLVLAETHAMLLRLRGSTLARTVIQYALDDASHQVVWSDAEIERAAVARWLVRFADQDFSLCDAVSFEVMSREHITRALAIDRHFATAGFVTL